MGIRVDEKFIAKSAERSRLRGKKRNEIPQRFASRKAPLHHWRGIGQSRICMYFLKKAHIGEVQSSVWPDSMIEICENANINLL